MCAIHIQLSTIACLLDLTLTAYPASLCSFQRLWLTPVAYSNSSLLLQLAATPAYSCSFQQFQLTAAVSSQSSLLLQLPATSAYSCNFQRLQFTPAASNDSSLLLQFPASPAYSCSDSSSLLQLSVTLEHLAHSSISRLLLQLRCFQLPVSVDH